MQCIALPQNNVTCKPHAANGGCVLDIINTFSSSSSSIIALIPTPTNINIYIHHERWERAGPILGSSYSNLWIRKKLQFWFKILKTSSWICKFSSPLTIYWSYHKEYDHIVCANCNKYQVTLWCSKILATTSYASFLQPIWLANYISSKSNHDIRYYLKES